MESWTGEDRSQHWREHLVDTLGGVLSEGSSSALLLARISATRPGGSAPSLIEQEGLLARAIACIEVSLAIPCEVQPLSLSSCGVVLTSPPSLECLTEISQQLRAAVEKHLTLDTAFEVQITIGMACAPEHAQDPRGLVEAADAALGCADEEGCVSLYSRRAQEEAASRQDRAIRLRHAIELDELSLHYQAQVDPRSGRASTFESLVRWNLDGEELLPGAFFGLAGDSFFLALGEWSLRESLQQLSRWRADGFGVQRVSVNLVAQQLRSGDLLGTVRSALQNAKLPPEALELELVETHLVEHLDRCGDTFEELRASGVRVAIDDFGTGYSSLSYLRTLPMDTLKIDRSLTSDVVMNPIERTIVSTVSQLAKGLQLTTVAEGVEYEDQYLSLASLGCDRLQGFWIARPKPAQACEEWMGARPS